MESQSPVQVVNPESAAKAFEEHQLNADYDSIQRSSNITKNLLAVIQSGTYPGHQAKSIAEGIDFLRYLEKNHNDAMEEVMVKLRALGASR